MGEQTGLLLVMTQNIFQGGLASVSGDGSLVGGGE